MPVKLERACGILFDAVAALEHPTEPRAPFRDSTPARLVVQRCSASKILKDVISSLEPARKLVAGGDIPRLARCAQVLRFSVSGVAAGDQEGCDKQGSRSQHSAFYERFNAEVSISRVEPAGSLHRNRSGYQRLHGGATLLLRA